MKKWDDLPKSMRNSSVKKYYDILTHKKINLFFKRLFDIVFSIIGLIILSPLFIIIAIVIKLDSKGPVFYRQERITQYCKIFRIFKFRTMIDEADKKGSLITTNNDKRITKIGKILRKTKIDELPQLINVLVGQMTIVGTRPEATKYVKKYKKEYYATLLLPAGITSEASIEYKEENTLINNAEDIDNVYMNSILPAKMKYNLESLNNTSLKSDVKIIIKTGLAILRKD